jgi:hypothetical protein
VVGELGGCDELEASISGARVCGTDLATQGTLDRFRVLDGPTPW